MRIVDVLILWLMKISSCCDTLVSSELIDEEVIVITNFNPQNVKSIESITRNLFLGLYPKLEQNSDISSLLTLQHYINFANNSKNDHKQITKNIKQIIGVEIINHLSYIDLLENDSFVDIIESIVKGTHGHAQCITSSRQNCSLHKKYNYDLFKQNCIMEMFLKMEINFNIEKNIRNIENYKSRYLYYCFLKCLRYFDKKGICEICLIYDLFIVYLEREMSRWEEQNNNRIMKYNITNLALNYHNDQEDNKATLNIKKCILFNHLNSKKECLETSNSNKRVFYCFNPTFDIPYINLLTVENRNEIIKKRSNLNEQIIENLVSEFVVNPTLIKLQDACFDFDFNLYLCLVTDDSIMYNQMILNGESYNIFNAELKAYYSEKFESLLKQF
ncbi:hypothetical protein COBT_002095 [Conglomerata obtusa]